MRALLALLFLGVATTACSPATAAVMIPSPAVDEPLAAAKSQRTVVLAGGCFWGIEAVLEHLQGVRKRQVRLCGRDCGYGDV